MFKHAKDFAVFVSSVMGALMIQSLLPMELNDTATYALLAVCAYGIYLLLCVLERYSTGLYMRANYGLPMEMAIKHIASGAAYSSYERESSAFREAFQAIHELSKDGEIRIAGCANPRNPPVRIPKRELKKLVRAEVVTPNGVVFALSDKSDSLRYMGLLLDSREFYKQWPPREKEEISSRMPSLPTPASAS